MEVEGAAILGERKPERGDLGKGITGGVSILSGDGGTSVMEAGHPPRRTAVTTRTLMPLL